MLKIKVYQENRKIICCLPIMIHHVHEVPLKSAQVTSMHSHITLFSHQLTSYRVRRAGLTHIATARPFPLRRTGATTYVLRELHIHPDFLIQR